MTVPFIDLHCDTLMQGVIPGKEQSLVSNTCAVDFQKLRRGGAMAQCFAVFLPQRDHLLGLNMGDWSDERYISAAVKCYRDSLTADASAAPALSGSDILQNQQAGRLSAVLTMEDGRALNNDLSNVDRFYQMGFRMIALLWNYENCLGYPNADDPAAMSRGLKPFGCEVVERMDRLGMLVDVSHLNEGGFWDVARLVKGPFVASHSNARALSPHKRNLTDAQLRTLGEHGGVTGLNFCPAFLNREVSRRESTAALLARHARHIVNAGGMDCCALGSDLDGTGGLLEIGASDRMPLLWDALAKEGFSEAQIEAVAYGNALRVFREVLQ